MTKNKPISSSCSLHSTTEVGRVLAVNALLREPVTAVDDFRNALIRAAA